MKRILVTLLTLAIVFSSFACNFVIGSADEATKTYEVLYENNFNALSDCENSSDLTAFNSAYGSNSKIITGGTLKMNVKGKDNNANDKYIEIGVNDPGYGAWTTFQADLSANIKNHQGKYVLSYDFMPIGVCDNGPYMRVKTEHYGPSGTDGWGPSLNYIGVNGETKPFGSYIKLTGDLNKDEMEWKGGTSVTGNQNVLTSDAWHNAKTIIDTANKTIDYYYDGEYVGTIDGDYYNSLLKEIEHFQIQIFQGYQSWYGFALDNIKFLKLNDATLSIEEITDLTVSNDNKSLLLEGASNIGSISKVQVIKKSNGSNIVSAYNVLYNNIYVDLSEALSSDVYYIYIDAKNKRLEGKLNPQSVSENDGETLIYSCDFNALDAFGTASSDLTAFNTAYGANSTIASTGTVNWQIKEKENKSDKYLSFGAADTTHAFKARFPQNIKNNKGVYKFSYDVKYDGTWDNGPFLKTVSDHFESSATDGWGAQLNYVGLNLDKSLFATYLTGVGNNGTWIWRGETNNIGSTTSLSIGAWHNVSFIIDNINNTVDYYYDNVYLGTQSGDDFTFCVGECEEIKIMIFNGWQAWTGVNLDNIKFSKVNKIQNISAIDYTGKKLYYTSNIDRPVSSLEVTADNTTASDISLKLGETAVNANVTANGNVYTVTPASILENGTYTLTVGTETKTFTVNYGANKEIELFVFKDSSGKVINSLDTLTDGDTITGTISIKNTDTEINNSSLIIAVYNNGKIVKTAVKNIDSTANVVSASANVTIDNCSGSSVKAFLLDANGTIKPLSEKIEIQSSVSLTSLKKN